MQPLLPQPYIDYIAKNGLFEGFLIRDDMPGYAILWPLEDIPRLNQEYGMLEYAPELLAFGSNGGGEALVFDSNGAVYCLPFIGLDSEDALFVANNFSELSSRFEYTSAFGQKSKS